MKLLQKQNQPTLNVLACFSQLERVIFTNYNFLLTLLGSSVYLSLTLIDLDFQKINHHQKIQIIVTSTLFILNIVTCLVKRSKQNFKVILHLIQLAIVLLSMEVFFLADKGQNIAFLISLLQLQHILCQNIEKNILISFFVWMSVVYLSIRLFLMLEAYSCNSIIEACIIIFSYLFALVFGQNVEVTQKQQHMINQINYDVGEQLKQRNRNIFSLYKNSHISTKSYLNVNSNQPRIKERDKKSSTQIFLNKDGSNKNHVEEQQNLNVTNQIQTPMVQGMKQRECDIECMINSYRMPQLVDQQNIKSQIFSDTEKLNKQDIASHSSSNLLNQNLTNIPQNEDQQKHSLYGLEQNSILQELTIGLIIIDDTKKIIFSNERSQQILKENNQSNLINKLQEYQTYSKGYQNINRTSNLYHQDLVKSSSAQDILEDKHQKQEKKPAYSQIQKMSSIILKEEDSCSPLLDPKKRKKDNKKGSVRIFPSLREIISQNNSMIEKESSKLIKTNIIINEDKLSSSDWKDDGLSILQPFWRSQHGYKLSIHQNEPSTFLPFKSDQHIFHSEVKKREIRRLNINLNKELQNFLKSKQHQTISIRQIFEILLEAGNYQSIEQNNQNRYIKSKSEQFIDTESSESKYFHKKQEFLNSQSKTRQDQLQGSTIIRNRRDSFNSNDNDDSIFQSRDVNPLSCSIQDNILVVKAQKGNEVIDLKISAMLEFLTVYENKSQRGSGSGETRNENGQEKVSLSPQKLEKISESLEEFKQQHNQKFGSQQLTQVTNNNEQKTDKIIFNFYERNKNLSKKIKQSEMKLFLIIEIQDKKEDIRQVNQEAFKDFKNRILSSLSHELRTPLNCSLQMLETIYQSDILSQNQKKMFILPAINSNYLLLSMINDILDFAQLINGGLNLQFEVFNIVDLIRECMSYFTLQAAYKNIHMELNFEKTIPIQVKSDSMRLKQVIINLLGNAIKFTNQGQISINVDQEEKDLIRISISDTGCGISPEIGNQIFRGLEFNHSNAQFNTEGVGMGLTIANNIAKGLSGNRPIQFVSDVGKGSTFSFFVLDRPQKIIGCKSTKFTIFNRSFTNWKPLFQENSDKIQPSTVFDQITLNNNRILGSNSVLPPMNHSIIPMNSQFNQSLLQNAQTPQVSQAYPIVRSNTFSNTSLPARSFNDFGQRIANYVNSNNQPTLQQPIPTNNKAQSYSEDHITSFNQIPKSFQDLSLKHTIDNNLSIEQSNNNQNHQSEGNIYIEQSFDIPKYKQTNEQYIHKRNLEHLYRIQQQMVYNNQQKVQNNQANQKFEQPITTSYKNIAINNNITSLKHIEENNNQLALVKKISCEVDTEYSNLNKPASPLIQQTYYVVAHKKQNKNQQNIQNSQFKGNQINKIPFDDIFDKHLKMTCLTDEPSGSYQYYQREDFSNKQLSPKIVSSLRTLHNDGFSVLESKLSRNDDEISQQQLQSQQNQSNKNSTNLLGQSNTSKNPIRIKDLEIEDMQSNLLYFLNSTFVHMQQSINLQQQQQQQQQQLPQQQYVQNSINNNQSISPNSKNNNNNLPNNSFSMQSNISINNNNSFLKNNQSRLMDVSPRSQKTALQPQIPIQQLSGSYQSLNIQGGKLIKKVLQFENQKTFESNPQNSPHSLPVKEEMRQRVDSIMSRKQESLNIRMENIIETHENQEHDDNTNSDNNLDYSNKSSIQGSMQKYVENQSEQVTYKQRIIQKNKQKTCNCPNVLVIDDNEFNLYALEMRLKQYGFIVDTASSGILGQQKVVQKHETNSCCKEYVIIFMDLDMPVQNGFQTTINILDYYKQSNEKPPIISACTAFIQESEKKKAKQAGMKYYITKPVETSCLEKVISKVLFKQK